MNAIKNGEVYLPYDTGFIFSEVNGDRVYWDVDDDDGSMKAGYVDTKSIGKFISTKEPGGDSRLDVTGDYKYEEGQCVGYVYCECKHHERVKLVYFTCCLIHDGVKQLQQKLYIPSTSLRSFFFYIFYITLHHCTKRSSESLSTPKSVAQK